MKPIYLAILTALLPLASFAQDANKPATTPPASKHPTEFQWTGGNLDNFIGEIDKTFGVNLGEIATIPRDMRSTVFPPKMHLLELGTLDFRQVLTLYNSLSDHGDLTLGHWIIEESARSGSLQLQAVVLVRPPASASPNFQVKAFPIPLIDKNVEKSVRLIQETVSNEGRTIADQLGATPSYDLLRGSMNFHPDTGIIVVAGPKPYVDLATAIIDALREKVQQSQPKI